MTALPHEEKHSLLLARTLLEWLGGVKDHKIFSVFNDPFHKTNYFNKVPNFLRTAAKNTLEHFPDEERISVLFSELKKIKTMYVVKNGKHFQRETLAQLLEDFRPHRDAGLFRGIALDDQKRAFIAEEVCSFHEFDEA